VFALIRRLSGGKSRPSWRGAPAHAGEGFVLPRPLRKPARVLGHVFAGDVAAPRYAATILSAVYLSAAGVYGMVLGGHTQAVLQALTARSGFAIEDVRMAGNKETSEIDVLDKLELNGWTSLIGFDAEEARQRIVALPWVDHAAVRKIYPDAIEISITEKKPLAIWQHGRELSLIDSQGRQIVPFRSERYATLPVFIGEGANGRAAEFVAEIEKSPGLASRVKAFIRIADRRWDLRLENGITVKLPENGEVAAIKELAALDAEHGILSRDVDAVDMRLDDRIVVKLTPEAVVRRDAALTELKRKSSRAGNRT
jgi:cell division protein FtsQ